MTGLRNAPHTAAIITASPPLRAAIAARLPADTDGEAMAAPLFVSIVEPSLHEDFEETVYRPFNAMLDALRPALAAMRMAGSGCVVLCAPTQPPAEDCPVRASLAGAIATLTRSIAYQYGPFAIRANAILPGALATDDDIAAAVALLAAPDSRFTTGACLVIGQPMPSRWPA